jgi:hypothetical protein
MNAYERVDGTPADAVAEAAPADDPEARVEKLTAEIDETRGDLSQTIGEIGQKLDPANIAHEATETVKQATLGKVDQMTYGAQETWRDVRTGNTGSLVDTIRSNPIPVGLVALGVGMLFMSRGQQGRPGGAYSYNGSSYRPDDRALYGRASWQTPGWSRRQDSESPLDKVGSTVAGAGERVSDAAGQAGEKLGEAFEAVGQQAGQIPEQAGYYLEQGGGQVRRFIDENPLGAGVIAMAAGAAIGMLLPTTPLERDTMGEARDQLVERVEGTVNEALDKVTEEASPQATTA